MALHKEPLYLAFHVVMALVGAATATSFPIRNTTARYRRNFAKRKITALLAAFLWARPACNRSRPTTTPDARPTQCRAPASWRHNKGRPRCSECGLGSSFVSRLSVPVA
ncbi:MAG: hypothetical protein ACOCWR_07815, partial [Oceanidesulfovibrio sp.]